MEDYKKIETEHYYKSLCRILPQFVGGKKVLDYGCGYGMHAVEITRDGAQEVIGVDLSTESLKIARELIEREGLGGKIKLLTMDCEALDIADNSFDIVFDGGTFSCLNPEKVPPSKTMSKLLSAMSSASQSIVRSFILPPNLSLSMSSRAILSDSVERSTPITSCAPSRVISTACMPYPQP